MPTSVRNDPPPTSFLLNYLNNLGWVSEMKWGFWWSKITLPQLCRKRLDPWSCHRTIFSTDRKVHQIQHKFPSSNNAKTSLSDFYNHFLLEKVLTFKLDSHQEKSRIFHLEDCRIQSPKSTCILPWWFQASPFLCSKMTLIWNRKVEIRHLVEEASTLRIIWTKQKMCLQEWITTRSQQNPTLQDISLKS